MTPDEFASMLEGLASDDAAERAAGELAALEALFAAHPNSLPGSAEGLAGHVPALLALLHGPNERLQLAAARGLVVASSGGPHALQAITAAGGVQALAECLNSSSNHQLAAAAAAALLNLAYSISAMRPAISAAGALPGLVRLLHFSECDREPATTLLYLLAADSCELAQAVAAAGAIPALIAALRTSTHMRVLSHSAQALKVLASRLGQPCRDTIAASGAVPVLLGLLSSGEAKVRVEACLTLIVLLSGTGDSAESTNARVAVAIAAAGGLPVLVSLVGSGNADERFSAAHLLTEIFLLHDAQLEQAAVAAGAIPALVAMSRASAPQVPAQEWVPVYVAVRALFALASRCEAATASAMVDGGAVPVLIEALHRQQPGPQEVAAIALAALAVAGSRRAIAEAGAIPALRRLAREGCDAAVQHAATTALHALSNSTAATAAAAATINAAAEAVQRAFAELAAPASPAAASPADGPGVPAAAAPAASHPWAAAPAAVAAASAPVQRPPRVCAAPGCSATSGLRRCGGCGAVRYCSEACSKAHWRAHKAECRRLQAEQAAAAPAAAGAAAAAGSASSTGQPASQA